MLIFHRGALGCFRIMEVEKHYANKQQHGTASRSTWNDLEYNIQNNKISRCDKKKKKKKKEEQ